MAAGGDITSAAPELIFLNSVHRVWLQLSMDDSPHMHLKKVKSKVECPIACAMRYCPILLETAVSSKSHAHYDAWGVEASGFQTSWSLRICVGHWLLLAVNCSATSMVQGCLSTLTILLYPDYNTLILWLLPVLFFLSMCFSTWLVVFRQLVYVTPLKEKEVAVCFETSENCALQTYVY